MKKVFIFFMVILALCMPIYAEETTVEEVTTTVEETATETLVETTIDNPDKIEEDKATVDSFIDKISSSTIWITVASIGGGAIAIITYVTKKFGHLLELIKTKADTKTIVAELKKGTEEVSDMFLENVESIKARLTTAEDNNKILMTVLSLFMVSTKISTPAKTEILKYLNGIKTVSGDIHEEVDKAIKVIEKAEALEEKVETPVLDKLTEVTSIALG